MKTKFPTWNPSSNFRVEEKTKKKIFVFSFFSLAGKNRDLNQAREKFEQLTVARRNLYDELEELRKSLEEKDREISTYEENRFSARKETFSRRIRFSV